jgi:metal transporter CNNM
MNKARVDLVLLALTALIIPSALAAVDSFYPTGYGIYQNGLWTIYSDTPTPLRLFGANLTNTTELTFTFSPQSCEFERHNVVRLTPRQGNMAEAIVTLPLAGGQTQYFCLNGVHQGVSEWLRISTVAPPDDSPAIPLGLEIFFIIILLFLSGLFSGLNLGLMSLDTTELKIVIEVGTETEQKYARAIMPLRSRGNMLLCTVLLGNVIVNSTLTILLDGVLGSGLFAVLGAAFGIVVIGEIFPQALCTRHALWVGAHTVWLMKFFMLLTFPISYPISLLLDRLLGEEIGAVYQRKQLVKLIQLTKENIGLGQSEFDIVTGALTYRDKCAGQIMTPLEDVFMVDLASKLDYRTMTRITQAGHSRIPVYSGARENIIGLLFVRDLTFVDPADCTPLEVVINHYNHPLEEVYDDTKLDELLDFFRQGRTHMCLVLHIDASGSGDPRRLVVGVVTLEDVIEEIIQAEILDEMDQPADDKALAVQPFTTTTTETAAAIATLSDQFTTAVLSFLSKYPQFEPPAVSPNVLRLLLQKPGVIKEHYRDDLLPEERILYKKGQAANTFTLVLEGRVKVTVGSDGFSFDSGPFTPLALDALQSSIPYVADFSAEVASERVLLLSITRRQLSQATKASRRLGRSSSHSLQARDSADSNPTSRLTSNDGSADQLLSPARASTAAGSAQERTDATAVDVVARSGSEHEALSDGSIGALGPAAAAAALGGRRWSRAAPGESDSQLREAAANSVQIALDESAWDTDTSEHAALVPKESSA